MVKKRNRKGFTIIELITVIAVLGILVLLAAPKFIGYVADAQEKRIRNDVRAVENKVAEFSTDEKYKEKGDRIGHQFFSGKKIYDKKGLVNYGDVREDGPYYIITESESAKEANSKLKGDFVSNGKGGTLYIVENEDVEASTYTNYSKRLAFGRYAGIATLSDGSFVTWGENKHSLKSTIPSEFSWDIALGRYNGLLIQYDGSISIWGSNDYGQRDDSPEGKNFESISIGNASLFAINDDGKLYSWGRDEEGQLDMPEGDYKEVAGGTYHTIGLKTDGTIVGAGGNGEGDNEKYGQVTDIPAGNDYVSVAAGLKHSLALKSDGSIVSWGRDFNKEVSDTPKGKGFIQIVASDYNSAALHEDGTIHVWGSDKYGQTDVPAINDFTSVYLGSYTLAGARKDGSIVSWGRNDYGQSSIPQGVNLNQNRTTNK